MQIYFHLKQKNIFILCQGREIARGYEQHVDPSNGLERGELITDFEEKPENGDVGAAIYYHGGGNPNSAFKRIKGKILDEDVMSGRYVSFATRNSLTRVLFL